MAATEAPWTSGPDLEGFVRREQDELLRVAYLVRGDLARAEALTEDALVAVGRRWARAAEEDPGTAVRGILYRSALAEADAAPPAPWPPPEEPDWATEDGGPEQRDRRATLTAALAGLTARQRAALTLLVLDRATEEHAAHLLGGRRHRVHADAGEALARLAAALPDLDLPAGRVDAPAVRWLLEATLEDVPDPDLAPRVLRRAADERRAVRRRTVLVSGGLVGAGVLATAVVGQLGAGAGTARTGDSRLDAVALGGVRVHLAPAPPAEAVLPRHPDRAALGVPDPIGPGDPTVVAVLEPGATGGPVLAVYLVHGGASIYVPVLQTPGPAPGLWRADAGRVTGEDRRSLVAPGAVSSDRRRVALPSVSGVVVIDVDAGTAGSVAIRDPTLRTVGWAADDRTVVARGRDDSWLVDPAAGTVQHTRLPVAPGWHELAWTGGTPQLRTLTRTGSLAAAAELPGPAVVPFGPSASSADGWVAAAAYLPGRYQDELGRSQGVVAVRAGAGQAPRVLAAEVAAGSGEVRYRVLRWVPPGTVLLESRSVAAADGSPVARVLAWDVAGERLWQVGVVEGLGGSSSWFSGQWGL